MGGTTKRKTRPDNFLPQKGDITVKSIGTMPTTLFGVAASDMPKAKKLKTAPEKSVRVCVFYKKGTAMLRDD